MKINILLAVSSVALGFSANAATPIEPGATITDQLKSESAAIEKMGGLIRSKGYRCDSISAARQMLIGRGFVIHCNRYSYQYEIEDKGGNWGVTVK